MKAFQIVINPRDPDRDQIAALAAEYASKNNVIPSAWPLRSIIGAIKHKVRIHYWVGLRVFEPNSKSFIDAGEVCYFCNVARTR